MRCWMDARCWARLVGCVVGFWLMGFCSAMAQDYGSQSAHFRINRVLHVEEIAADFTAVRTLSLEREALSVQGAVAVGKHTLSFNPDLESLDILEAFTQKADGQKIAVDSQAIQRQTGLLAPGTGISWPGVQLVQVVFPNVLPGDKTFIRWRHAVRQAALPQWLSTIDLLPNMIDVQDFRVELSAPLGMPIQVAAERLDLKTSTEQGKQLWIIHGQGRGFSDEPVMANGLKQLPYWMYSTLPTRAALSDVFASKLREKNGQSPDIQTLARQITQGMDRPRDKAQAIHRWVTQNIRYVAVFVGVGGYVPNDLASILARRYGDCKDMTLLTIALLEAAGIESAPALVNAVNADWVPPVAAPLYNHVIVYIPGLDVFTDPTAQNIPFGKLPALVAARPVLVGLKEGSREMRTPVFSGPDNSVQVRSRWVFDQRGGAKVELQVNGTGLAATGMQDQLEQIPDGATKAAVQRYLKAANLTGTGRLNYAPVQRNLQEQSLAAFLELEGVLSNPQAGSLPLHPGISSIPTYLSDYVDPEWLPGRRFDAMCTPVKLEENFSVEFPAGTHILAMPKAVQVDSAGIRFSSEYGQTATGWSGRRVFERLPTASGHVCTLEDIRARRPAIVAIRKHVRDVVLYKSE
jgi:hypothetical protein